MIKNGLINFKLIPIFRNILPYRYMSDFFQKYLYLNSPQLKLRLPVSVPYISILFEEYSFNNILFLLSSVSDYYIKSICPSMKTHFLNWANYIRAVTAPKMEKICPSHRLVNSKQRVWSYRSSISRIRLISPSCRWCNIVAMQTDPGTS